jgi:hypothetical protein
MTDEIESIEQTVSSDNAPQGEEAVVNDSLPRETVSKIVERERQKAFEKGKREAMMEIQQQQAPMASQDNMQQAPQGQNQGMGGMPQMSPQDIERMIAEKAPQMLQDHVQSKMNEHMVNTFVNKMQAAESKYPGINEQLNDLDYQSLAPLVEMANNMDNTADVMKELLDHPMKMGNLLTLQYTQPRLAQKAMTDLSSSIKTNKEAKEAEAQARDPMSQLKPSSSAGVDNGAMSVSDFRKMFR